MARRRAHEEHANHEAWAIPYGDLVTLLLALFVVLYSMSSVNEGKYRVLSDSLNEAFGGRPRSPSPIQIGDNAQRGSAPSLVSPVRLPLPSYGQPRGGERDIRKMAAAMTKAMGALIDRKLVTVRANGLLLEIEIRADILFPSGVAAVSERARPVLTRVASVLAPFPNPVRIEGHTDNVPVATAVFPSNWQLSAARAASVVALFVADGVDPRRLSVAGFGEFRPKAPNTSSEGRNANRRVLIVVQGSEEGAARRADPLPLGRQRRPLRRRPLQPTRCRPMFHPSSYQRCRRYRSTATPMQKPTKWSAACWKASWCRMPMPMPLSYRQRRERPSSKLHP